MSPPAFMLRAGLVPAGCPGTAGMGGKGCLGLQGQGTREKQNACALGKHHCRLSGDGVPSLEPVSQPECPQTEADTEKCPVHLGPQASSKAGHTQSDDS